MALDNNTKTRIAEICEECRKHPHVPVSLMLHTGAITKQFIPSVEIVYLEDFKYFSIVYSVSDINAHTKLTFLSVTAQTAEDIYRYCEKHENTTYTVQQVKEVEKLKVNEIIGIANFELVRGRVNVDEIVRSGYDEYYIDLEELADQENFTCFYLIDHANCGRIRGVFLGDELNGDTLMNVFDNLDVYLTDVYFNGAIDDYALEEDKAKLRESSWEDLIKYFETHKTGINEWSEWHLNVLRLLDNPNKYEDLVSQEL